MTRDAEQIQLNEIHVLCVEVADHYQAIATHSCVLDMEAIFLEAAREYREFAAEIASYIRLHDDQPRLPDPDKETLGLFFTSIKTKLAFDERQVLIEDQAKVEERLSEATKMGLQCGLPPEVKRILERLLAKSSSMQQILRSQQ